MPFGSLKLIPGVNVEKTLSLNEAGVSASSFVRWREGLPEKRGGWAKFVNAVFTGVPRALHAWEDINSGLHLAVGATTQLSVVTSGNIQDVTPQLNTSNHAVNIDTLSTSKTVTIHDTASNANIYDSVVFKTPVSIGGIVLHGAYQVAASISANAYTIVAATTATGTVTGGGAVPTLTSVNASAAITVTLANHGQIVGSNFPILVATTVGGVVLLGQYIVTSVTSANAFVINAATTATSGATVPENGGNASLSYYVTQGPPIPGSGFGVGGFGSGGFGVGVGASAPLPVPDIVSTDYWLDNWGEILIACPTGGPIFTWSPDSGVINAVLIVQAPLANKGVFVAMPEQMLMAWGSSFDGVSDPLQINWCDAANFNLWTPAATNQAGGFHIPTGSQIVRGMQGPQQTLWWTDIDLYSAQYVGQPFIWGFTKIAGGCGLIAPKAVAILGTTIYWMSQKQFFSIGGGGVQAIDCPVWDAVFQNMNTNFVNNIRGGGNSQFNEISWDFPSASSTNGENDQRVTFNPTGPFWDVQPINRSAWIDQSVLGSPLGASSSGVVYQHEVAPDADGVAMVTSLSTGYFTLSEGEEFVFVDKVMPDFRFGTYSGSVGASLQFTFNVVNDLSDTPTAHGPFTVTSATPYIEPRFRGRYVQYVISGNDVGSFWRWGRPRFRYAPDGKV